MAFIWYNVWRVTQEPLAQVVEHRTFNPGVGGSNPPWLTMNARVVELADTQDLGSCASKAWGFKSPLSHHHKETMGNKRIISAPFFCPKV
jgi:hypothetical protein